MTSDRNFCPSLTNALLLMWQFCLSFSALAHDFGMKLEPIFSYFWLYRRISENWTTENMFIGSKHSFSILKKNIFWHFWFLSIKFSILRAKVFKFCDHKTYNPISFNYHELNICMYVKRYFRLGVKGVYFNMYIQTIIFYINKFTIFPFFTNIMSKVFCIFIAVSNHNKRV